MLKKKLLGNNLSWLIKRLVILLLSAALLLVVALPAFADPLDNWHWRNPLPQGNTLKGIAYGNGTFVAVGESGTILTSTDGTTWTSRTSGTTYGLNSVTYGSGTFVTVGDNGTILQSDPLSITDITPPGLCCRLSKSRNSQFVVSRD